MASVIPPSATEWSLAEARRFWATSPSVTTAASAPDPLCLRDVPADSTVVGVPGHIVFRHGKRVVITDPKQINDPSLGSLGRGRDRG